MAIPPDHNKSSHDDHKFEEEIMKDLDRRSPFTGLTDDLKADITAAEDIRVQNNTDFNSKSALDDELLPKRSKKDVTKDVKYCVLTNEEAYNERHTPNDFDKGWSNAMESAAKTDQPKKNKKSVRFDDAKNTTQIFERGRIYKDRSPGSQHTAQATQQAKQTCERNNPGLARRAMNWMRGVR